MKSSTFSGVDFGTNLNLLCRIGAACFCYRLFMHTGMCNCKDLPHHDYAFIHFHNNMQVCVILDLEYIARKLAVMFYCSVLLATV